jgi:hypothetical protein
VNVAGFFLKKKNLQQWLLWKTATVCYTYTSGCLKNRYCR